MSQLKDRRTLAFRALWAVVVLACTSQAASVAITVTLATKNAPTDGSIYRIALAASFSDILAMPCSVAAAFLRGRHIAHRTRIILSVALVLLALSAAVLGMYTLVWIWEDSHLETQENHTGVKRSLTKAGFAIWGIVVVGQTLLCLILFWPKISDLDRSPMQELGGRASSARLVKRSISARSTQLVPSSSPPTAKLESQPVSSAFSAYSISPRSSFRNSVSKVLRPVTSKTKLFLQHSFTPQDSGSLGSGRGTPSEPRDEPQGIERFDSALSLEDASDVKLPRISRKQRLETIPGSRPPSRAFPLSGPFLVDSDCPTASPLMLSSSENSSHITLTRSHSNIQSNIGQSHIHPLFRSESPTPPPVASPGTVITASPFAGQIVSADYQSIGLRRWHSARAIRQDNSA